MTVTVRSFHQIRTYGQSFGDMDVIKNEMDNLFKYENNKIVGDHHMMILNH